MSEGRKSGRYSGWVSRLIRLGVTMGIVIFVVVVVGATIAVMQYRDFERSVVLAEGESLVLDIPDNTSWPGVVDRVDETGMIQSALYFDLWGRQSGLADSVRAGTFYLEGPLYLDELAQALRQGGRAEEVVVTLPEGLTIFDIADRLQESGLVERGEFLDDALDVQRFDNVPTRADSLEGYLYPDTYRFARIATAPMVVERLVEQWNRAGGSLFEEYAGDFAYLQQTYDFDRHDVVTMASIIERETSVDGERDVIARVFYNRLDRGMMLQTDPTCVYGEETYHLTPTPELCHDPLNQYSTYVIEGLPPGPIANPGRASLRAALQPSDDPEAQDYLFFVSRRDGSGEHYFSTNYDDHRRAIERYLRQ